jgi:hypothetical protein
MRNENELIWEEFLKESPWGYAKLPSAFEQKMLETDVDEIRKNDEFVDNFDGMDIYHSFDGEEEIYYVLNGDDVTAYYRFQDMGKYLKTKLIWNSKKYAGTLRKFLAEYLLPRHGIIESDDAFSNDAFTLWQKMVVMYPNYEFYAKFPNGKLSERMTNYHEPLIYREPFPKDGNSVFIMKYNK